MRRTQKTNARRRRTQRKKEKVHDGRSYMIQIIGDMSVERIRECNAVIHHSFHPGTDDSQPYLENFSKDTVCSLVVYNNRCCGIALAEPKRLAVDPEYLSDIQINIHSIAIDPQYQGRGLCRELVSTLVMDIKQRFKHLVRHGIYPFYLHVRVGTDNANHSAIKCYQHNHFEFVDVPPVERNDGPNGVMRWMPPKTHPRIARKSKKKQTKKKKPKKK